jgi:pyruvate dehydrogenase (quinone)
MTKTVGDFLWQRLRDNGIHRVFGYPGDGINGLVGALDRAHNDPEFVQVRHEEMAAFMAAAHAKFTGEVGVCLATSGPGAIHLLNGLYDARLDHQPVVAIVGQQARAALGGHYQQETDLPNLFKDVAGAFVQQASTPTQIRHLVDRAVRIARSDRTVTAIILPNDLQEMDAVETPPHAHGTVHSGIGAPVSHPFPPDAELHRAAEVLNAGKRVAMLVGAGALHATDELIQVAERLGAGVAKALLGKAALPDELPWVTGSIGLLGTKPSWDLMQNCDTLLMVGSGFPYSEFLPQEGKARGVQIDTSAGMLSLRYPMEVNLLGDSKATLRAASAAAAEQRSKLATDRGEERRGLVEAIAGTCHATRRSAQSAARVLGTLVAPARWRDHRQRLWLRRQLVRPRPAHPARHDVLTVRWSRQHGRRCALRDRRQVRPSGSPSHRFGW